MGAGGWISRPSNETLLVGRRGDGEEGKAILEVAASLRGLSSREAVEVGDVEVEVVEVELEVELTIVEDS